MGRAGFSTGSPSTSSHAIGFESMNIFGNIHLGYVVVDTENYTDWRRFGRDAIGMRLDEASPDVAPGPPRRSRLPFPGSSTGPPELSPRSAGRSMTIARSTKHRPGRRAGRAPSPRSPSRRPPCAASAGWSRFAQAGWGQEIFNRPGLDDAPLEHGERGGFITEKPTMGAAIAVTSTQARIGTTAITTASRRPRLTDYIDETMQISLKFWVPRLRQENRCSVTTPSRSPGSTSSPDFDPIRSHVGRAENVPVRRPRRMTRLPTSVDDGFQMALAVGQHTNDRELSYYAMTPSGFEWEVGWNPIVIDEKTWEPTTYQGISLWGHTREGQTIVEKLAQFKTAAQSLLHREDTVPALAYAAIPDD